MPFDAVSYIAGKNAGGGGGSSVTVEPLSVTENGEYTAETGTAYSPVNVAVPQTTVESLSVTENGTTTAPSGKAYSPVVVSVPNTYSAGDEGKVVSNGALVAQTAHAEVTSNGTIDTTLNNSVVVNVSGGGGTEVPSNDVNFIDYDGTIVASYSAADFANLSALPSNPSHTGLTAQGWNWSLADAKTYVASCGGLDIGQMYTTSDGKTRVYCHFEDTRDMYIQIAVNGTVTVDFGDETATANLTGTSLTTNKSVKHTFTAGDRVITFTPATNSTFAFYGTSSNNKGAAVINPTQGAASDQTRFYQCTIRKVELGVGASIGSYGLYLLSNLESITIPNTVTTIGERGIGSTVLKHLTIPSNVTSLSNYAFYNNSNLKSISLPKALSGIPTNTFYSNITLTRITIPDGVTSIGQSAFDRCFSLSSIFLPASVDSIANYAFRDILGAASIRFYATVPATVTSSSFGIATGTVIYIPYSAIAAYYTAANYPSKTAYKWFAYATYANGATLPTQDTTSAYNVTWYATPEDAKAGTNAITTGNGAEIYCTYTAV